MKPTTISDLGSGYLGHENSRQFAEYRCKIDLRAIEYKKAYAEMSWLSYHLPLKTTKIFSNM